MASTSFLQKAYLAYFGRPVDFIGSTAFANSTELEVQAAFSASDESQALYGPTFGPAQINAFYNILFGRDAEPAGLAYWINQVQLGLVTPAGAAIAILNGARNDDVTAVNNKLLASAAFTAALDTTPEILGYSGDASAGVARTFLSTVTLNLATPAAVDTAVLEATELGNRASGAIFNLGTESETVVGTFSNDRFVATEKTLAFDEINGGAGVDSLRIVASTEGINGSLGETVSNVENVIIQTLGNVDTDISGYTGVQNVSVTAINGADIGLVSAAANSVNVKAIDGSVDLTDETAASITVDSGSYVNVTAGDAETITVDSGSDVTVIAGDAATITVAAEGSASVNANSVATAAIDSDGSATLMVVESIGAATVTADGSVLITAASAGSIDAKSGSVIPNDEGMLLSTIGFDAVVNVTGNAGVVSVDAGGIGRVVVGSADSITVKSGSYVDQFWGEDYEHGYDAVVKAASNVGSIDMNAGEDGRIDVGVAGVTGFDNGEGSQAAAVATVVANVDTINVIAKEIARVEVTGNAGSITIDADKAFVQVGVYGEESYNEGSYEFFGLANTLSTAGLIDVTSARAADIYVTGGVGTVSVDAGGDVEIEIGVEGYGGSENRNDEGDVISSSTGLVNVTSSVGAINVTTTDYADVFVTGNAGTINVNAANGADIEVGLYGYGSTTDTSSDGSVNQSYGSANVASKVDAINVTSMGEDADDVDVDVVGNVGTITINSTQDVDVNIGYEGDAASTNNYFNYIQDYAGVSAVASTVAAIDVTSGDDIDIEVIGNVGTLNVTGDDVDVTVGFAGYDADSSFAETGFGNQGLAAVISNVDSIEVAAEDDVEIDVTGNATNIAIVTNTDNGSSGEVDVNVGGMIDALTISGAEEYYGEDTIDVTAASIGTMTLTDVSDVTLDSGEDTVQGDVALVFGEDQAISIQLTNSVGLDLTIAGVIAGLSVEGTGTVTTVVDGEDVTTDINVETLNLTVDTFTKTFIETVKTLDENGEIVLDANLNAVTTDVSQEFTIDSEIDLSSDDVKTLNVSGAGNLVLDVAAANALNLIDAQTATGNITVTLDGEDAVSYNGGSGADTVTLINSLPQVDLDDAWTFSVDGGAGTADTLLMTASLAQSALAGQTVSGFEVLNLSGATTQSVNATLFGTSTVVLDGAGGMDFAGIPMFMMPTPAAFDLTIANEGTVELNGSTAGLGLVVMVDGASGEDEVAADYSLSLVLSNDNSEGVNVTAAVANVGAVSVTSAGGNFNVLSLSAADATALTITGDAALDLTGNKKGLFQSIAFGGGDSYVSESTLSSVTMIDASTFNSGLVVDLSANTVAATVEAGNGSNIIVGTQGNDTITVGNGSIAGDSSFGNLIVGGLGKDTIQLTAGTVEGAASDVLSYRDAVESNGVNVDVISGFDVNHIVQAEVLDADGEVTTPEIMVNDLLDLSGLDYDATYNDDGAATYDHDGDMGVMTDEIATPEVAVVRQYIGEAEGYGAVLTSLVFGEANAVLDISTSILYVDVNADGALSVADLSIKLTGVTDLSEANFNFYSMV